MKINNIQNYPKGEVVVVNRKVNFQAQPKQAAILKPTVERLSVDMTTRVGYEGPGTFSLAPEDFKDGLGMIFRKMGINWDTHIDPSKPKKRFA